MIDNVFHFLSSALVILVLTELATLIFVAVHEVFCEKRRNLRNKYKDKFGK